MIVRLRKTSRTPTDKVVDIVGVQAFGDKHHPNMASIRSTEHSWPGCLSGAHQGTRTPRDPFATKLVK